MICSFHFSIIQSIYNSILIIIIMHMWLTQSDLEWEAQQFLVVLNKWGGSEMKKNARFSSDTKGFDVWCASSHSSLCNLILLLEEAPSDVTPMIFKLKCKYIIVKFNLKS